MRDTDTEEKPLGNSGRDWRDVATRPGPPGAPEAGRGREKEASPGACGRGVCGTQLQTPQDTHTKGLSLLTKISCSATPGPDCFRNLGGGSGFRKSGDVAALLLGK